MKKSRLFKPETRRKNTVLLLLIFSLPLCTLGQKTVVTDSTDPGFRTVIAGEEYKKGPFYQFLWGAHYRKEWTTPVRVPVIDLDKSAGGLTPIEQGGGRQTQTLRLKNSNGKQYVLRTVDKDYGKALPDILRGTFIESLARDQVSTGHPFAAITVPGMIKAAGVYHTLPVIGYIPYTPSLGKFNETFANTLCLLEERPDENQEDAPNFGYAEDVKGTEKTQEKVLSENDHRIDQKAFVRARLFDMFLGDWGRHDDQWRWAEFDSAGFKIYRPIPRDRDQAYSKFDGFLTKKLISSEDLEHLQTFSYKIRNVKKYNFPARYIDRQFTNEVPEQTWIGIANDLQQRLTDAVIRKSVEQMPPELFSISGEEIIAKLRSRRNDLPQYAAKYYKFLSKSVDIIGSRQNELFLIRRLPHNEIEISLFALNKQGQPKGQPFYSRIFNSDKTHEIRLYGLQGNDVYRIEGEEANSTKIRIIGGTDRDSVINESSSTAKLKYYDNPGNAVTGRIRSHFSNDTSINAYNYREFKYHSGNTIKSPNYSNTRGIFIQGGYKYTRQQWRKEPFGWQQALKFNYSLSNNSFGGDYEGIFNELIGKWSLLLNARYDQKLKNYYFGLGNETVKSEKIEYYQMFTQEALGSLGLSRLLGRYQAIGLTGFYESITVRDRGEDHFINKAPPSSDGSTFARKNFAGAELMYRVLHLNDSIVPTRGIGFLVWGSHTENLTQTSRSFVRYSAALGFYIPFTHSFSLAVRTGGIRVSGDPEFYQLAWLGGGQNLRGFHRQRFFGKTAFFDNNELRWIRDVKGYVYAGKIGLVAFLDNGRVWTPGQDSNQWHFGYGGGLMLVPFNRISLTVYYGTSKDDRLLHLRLGRFF